MQALYSHCFLTVGQKGNVTSIFSPLYLTAIFAYSSNSGSDHLVLCGFNGFYGEPRGEIQASWWPDSHCSVLAVSWHSSSSLYSLLDPTLHWASRTTSQAINAADPMPMCFHFWLGIYRRKKLMKRVVSEERQGEGGNMNCWRKSKRFLWA